MSSGRSPPDEFAQFIAREVVKWAAAAEAAGLRNSKRPRPREARATSGYCPHHSGLMPANLTLHN